MQIPCVYLPGPAPAVTVANSRKQVQRVSPLLFRLFPKRLRYPLGAGQKVSNSLYANLLLIFLRVQLYYLVKIKNEIDNLKLISGSSRIFVIPAIPLLDRFKLLPQSLQYLFDLPFVPELSIESKIGLAKHNDT